MNYAELTLRRELKKLQSDRRRFNLYWGVNEKQHWDKEFSLIRAIRLLKYENESGDSNAGR